MRIGNFNFKFFLNKCGSDRFYDQAKEENSKKKFKKKRKL